MVAVNIPIGLGAAMPPNQLTQSENRTPQAINSQGASPSANLQSSITAAPNPVLSTMTGALQWLFEPQPAAVPTILQTPSAGMPSPYNVNVQPSPGLSMPVIVAGVAGIGALAFLVLRKKKRR